MADTGTEQSTWDACGECMISAVAKFCSLIVVVCMMIGEIVYVVGVLKLSATIGKMHRIVIAHFMGMFFSLLAVAGYMYLFMRGMRQQQFMSVLTGLLIVSLLLVSHSVGAAGPTVIDCGGNFSVVTDTFVDVSGSVANQISNATLNRTIVDQAATNRGSYDQDLEGCYDQAIILGGAIVVAFFQLIAIFDVQRMLLRRVRAKTYGQRFSEMGISSGVPA